MTDFQLSTTARLLNHAKAGDSLSRNALAERLTPRLRQLAYSRLPKSLSARVDPEDIVQETLLRAFSKIDRFEPRCEGAFMFYLRRILKNVVTDHGRRLQRSAETEALESEPVGLGPSPIEEAVGRELWEKYQASLEKLSEAQSVAVVLFVEYAMAFEEIAEAIDSPSANAARMVVARGLKRLAELMDE